jgi:hypothetical protein
VRRGNAFCIRAGIAYEEGKVTGVGVLVRVCRVLLRRLLVSGLVVGLIPAVAVVLLAGRAGAATHTTCTDPETHRQVSCSVDPPSASFTWDVRNISTRDHGTDITNNSADTNRTGPLRLDGCNSDSGDPRHPGLSYYWTVTDDHGNVSHPTPNGCRTDVDRPLTDRWLTWVVTLKISRRGGKPASDSSTQTIRFRDLLIASLGDSAASGQGNPDVPTSYTFFGGTGHLASWNDFRCDRSGRAATALLAKEIEDRNPGTSVTLWSLACSGASITDKTTAFTLPAASTEVCRTLLGSLKRCWLDLTLPNQKSPTGVLYGGQMIEGFGGYQTSTTGPVVAVSTGGGPAKLYVAAPIAFGASTIALSEGVFANPPHRVVPAGALITVEDYGNGGMLAPYSGQTKCAVYAPSGCKKDCSWTFTGTCRGEPSLPPQVDRLADLVKQAGRPLDALLMTIGANDLSWTQMVKDCYKLVLFNKNAKCVDAEGPGILAREQWSPTYGNVVGHWTTNPPNLAYTQGFLPDRFALLAQALQAASVVAPKRTFLTGYWDATADNRDGGQTSVNCPDRPVIPSQGTRKWGQLNVIRPLNEILENQPDRPGFGWTWVPGIEQAFYGHGLCSTHRWIVSATTSDTEQGHGKGLVYDGKIFDDTAHQNDLNGSWHANYDGQKAVAQILYKSLSGPVLGSDGYDPPSIAIIAPANGSSVTAGQPVQLSASASGYDNDPVSVQWSDSAAGVLGTGATITTAFDSSHANRLLTATVTDLISGQTASASVFLTVASSTTPTGPPGWAYCATEGSTCPLSLGNWVVAYGADGAYYYKGVGGSVSCDNTTFGGDPAPNVQKACFSMADPPGYLFCVVEGGTCPFLDNTDIAYGADGRFYYKYGVSGSVACNTATFGGDPAPYVQKACFTLAPFG